MVIWLLLPLLGILLNIIFIDYFIRNLEGSIRTICLTNTVRFVLNKRYIGST